MPLYTLSSRADLSAELQQQVAEQIVTTHCSLTGAPPTFVNVIFWQHFPLAEPLRYHLFYAVRKGREGAINQVLARSLVDDLCRILAIEHEELDVQVIEVPASWVMEGGHVLPEPGEEENCDWLSKGNALD